jgi:hypothetical protein
MVEFTAKYGLYKPDFNVSGWHQQVNGNFDSIDSLLFAVLGLGNFVGEWTNSTNYTEQQRVFDPDDGTIWNCLVDHTSAATDSFSDDRADNPTFWNSVSSVPIARGAWQNDTLYGAGDISYDAGESLVGIADTTHTSSSSPNTMRDDAANWTFIADLSLAAVLVNSVNAQTGTVVLDADDIAETATRKWAGATDAADLDAVMAAIAGYTTIVTRSIDSMLPPTGMMMPWPSSTDPTQVNGNGTTPSWLVCDGGTIGDVSSGATERANADMQALFSFLWTNSANAELHIQTSAGAPTTRGASAAADFGANKRMPIPDCRGGTIYFGDNGAGRITATGHSTNFDQLGAESVLIEQENLPDITFPNDLSGELDSAAINNGTQVARNPSTNNNAQSGGGSNIVNAVSTVTLTVNDTSVTISGDVESGGGDIPLTTLSPGTVIKNMVIKT